MKKIKKITVLLLLACAAMTAQAQRVINLNDEKANISLQKRVRGTDANVELKESYPGEIKAYRLLEVNPALTSPETVSVGDTIILELFEDKVYKAVVSNIETTYDGLFALKLKLPLDKDDTGFNHIVTTSEGKSLVNVKNFEIRTPSDGQVYLVEIDRTNAPPPSIEPFFDIDIVVPEVDPNLPLLRSIDDEGNEIIRDNPKIKVEIDENGNETIIRDGESFQKKKDAPAAVSSADCTVLPVAKENPNDPATIDLMILYTPEIEEWAQKENRGGITYLIYLMVNKINTPFDNSNTGITLHRVRSEVVNYKEPTPYDMSVTLDRLIDPGDGFMDDILDWRTEFGADLIQLITMENVADGSPANGISKRLLDPKGRHEEGFSVVNVKVLDGLLDNNNYNYLISCHEFGHSYGLLHGAEQIEASSPILFPYAYGWRWQEKINNYTYGNNYYCTVMSYTGASDYEDGNPSIRIPYFSNPDIIQYGQPTGVADKADAARTLREMKHVIASYSDRLTTFPAMPTNIVVSNETEHGARITWNAAPNATSYQVSINTNAGWRNMSETTNLQVNLSDPDFLSPGTTYQFYIKAINDCGNVRTTIHTFTTTDNPTNLEDNTAKEIQSTDCYTVTGIKTNCNSDTPGVVIKRTNFTDGSTQVVKELR